MRVFRKNLPLSSCLLSALAVLSAGPAQATLTLTNTAFGANTGVLDSTTGYIWLRFNSLPQQSFNELAPQLGSGNFAATASHNGFALATTAQVGALRQSHFGSVLTDPVGLSAAFSSFTTIMGTRSVRDGPGGNGCALEMTALTAEVFPGITVTPLTSSGVPTGPNVVSGVHGISGIGIVGRQNNSAPCPGPTMLTDNGLFGGSRWLDVFDTNAVIFSRDYRPVYSLNGFFITNPGDELGLPQSITGFWLVATSAAAVPEPQTLALLCGGLCGLAIARRRKRERKWRR